MTERGKTLLTLSVVALLCNVVVSFFLLRGYIDQDFFTQCFVGKGVWQGEAIYSNFSDNKGPILYFFFAILYFIFGSHYQLALAIGCLFLHFLVALGLIFFVFTRLRVQKISFVLIIWVVSICLLIDSFVLGGLYAETLGMVFLVWSLVCLKKGKYFVSGVLFGLSIMSRQTLFLFMPYVIYLIFQKRQLFLHTMILFVLGVGLVLAFLFGYLYLHRDLESFFYNSVLFNFYYSQAVSYDKWRSVGLGLYDGGLFRPFLVLLFSFSCWIWTIIRDRSFRVELSVMFLCSIFVVYLGGYFYSHHFFQFALCASVLLAKFLFESKHVFLRLWCVFFLLLLVVGRYSGYVNSTYYSFLQDPAFFQVSQAISQKKYLMVVTFFPQLYLDYGKSAPDKYFQPFFISSFSNSDWQNEAKKHRQNVLSLAKDTAFVIVSYSAYADRVGQAYLENFGSDFQLQRVVKKSNSSGLSVEVYGSVELP